MEERNEELARENIGQKQLLQELRGQLMVPMVKVSNAHGPRNGAGRQSGFRQQLTNLNKVLKKVAPRHSELPLATKVYTSSDVNVMSIFAAIWMQLRRVCSTEFLLA